MYLGARRKCGTKKEVNKNLRIDRLLLEISTLVGIVGVHNTNRV